MERKKLLIPLTLIIMAPYIALFAGFGETAFWYLLGIKTGFLGTVFALSAYVKVVERRERARLNLLHV